VDGFDVLDRPVLSPRTTFLIKPTANQTFRLSYNRAFRAPSFVNSFLETSFLNAADLGPAGAFHFLTFAAGNADLQQEALTAYEIGYMADVGRMTLGAATYVNRTQDMIQFTQTSTYDSANPPPGWPLPPALLDQLKAQGRGLPLRLTYLNFNRIDDRGVELSADARFTNGISAFANYSWQADPRPRGFDRSELNLPPAYRVHVGARVRHEPYFGTVSASVVGGAYWQDVLPGYEGHSRQYTVLDGAFGVHSADAKMAAAVRATNLLDASIQQHVFGDIIRRAISAELLLRF
jgi:outer membrane receptor protein involved in Fe transport